MQSLMSLMSSPIWWSVNLRRQSLSLTAEECGEDLHNGVEENKRHMTMWWGCFTVKGFGKKNITQITQSDCQKKLRTTTWEILYSLFCVGWTRKECKLHQSFINKTRTRLFWQPNQIHVYIHSFRWHSISVFGVTDVTGVKDSSLVSQVTHETQVDV